MPQAKITINSVPGSDTNLTINTLVALDNQNVGGELTYAWSILDQPPGAVDSLSSVSIQNPFFTPKKEGTYLLKLIVNQGLPTEQEDRVVAAVKQLKTLERIPAAGETTEADTSDGWATASNSYLRRMDALLVDPGVMVGVNASGGTLVRGNIVRAPGVEFIKATLPGAEGLPGFTRAHANVLGEIDELLCVVESDITGIGVSIPGTGPTEARLMRVRYIGRFVAITGTPAAGDTVYVNDGGSLSLTPGTIRRRVGSVMTGAYTNDVWFNGVGGADIDLTPIDRAYVIWGNPGALPNALRVDGANATGVPGVPFRIAAGAGAVGLQVVGAAGQNIQEWYDSGTTMRAHISSSGQMVFDAGVQVNVGGITVAAGGITISPGGGDLLINNVGQGVSWFGGPKVYANSPTALVFQTIAAGGGGMGLATTAGVLQLFALSGTGLPSVVIEQLVAGAFFGTFSNNYLTFITNNTARWQITATGELGAVGAQRPIHNVLNPALAQDVVTKNYHDTFFPNLVLNGHFGIWQRGTNAISLSEDFGSAIREKKFLADRWGAWATFTTAAISTADILSYSRTSVGSDPDVDFAARLRFTTIATAATDAHVWITQEIDRDLVRRIRGRKLTVQFKWRKGSAMANDGVVRVVAYNGNPSYVYDSNGYAFVATAATATDPGSHASVGYYGDATVGVTSVLDATIPNASIGTSLTPNVVITTVIVPADAKCLVLCIGRKWTAATTTNANDYLDVTAVQLMDSEAPCEIFRLKNDSEAAELIDCQRFYEKSYEVDTAPGTAGPPDGEHYTSVLVGLGYGANSIPLLGSHPRFLVDKRAVPTVELFIGATVGSWYVGGVRAVTPRSTSRKGFLIQTTAAFTPAEDYVNGHWVADAEI